MPGFKDSKVCGGSLVHLEMRILIGKAGVDDESALHIFFFVSAGSPLLFFCGRVAYFFFIRNVGYVGKSLDTLRL